MTTILTDGHTMAGDRLVTGAHTAGASVVRAVEIACERDCYSGGGVDVVALD